VALSEAAVALSEAAVALSEAALSEAVAKRAGTCSADFHKLQQPRGKMRSSASRICGMDSTDNRSCRLHRLGINRICCNAPTTPRIPKTRQAQ